MNDDNIDTLGSNYVDAARVLDLTPQSNTYADLETTTLLGPESFDVPSVANKKGVELSKQIGSQNMIGDCKIYVSVYYSSN